MKDAEAQEKSQPAHTNLIGEAGIDIEAVVGELNNAHLDADQRSRLVATLETIYTAELENFEHETRLELTRIARDESLTREAKLIHLDNWFSRHADRINKINWMAENLDKVKPSDTLVIPSIPISSDPEGVAAKSLRELARGRANGEITIEEYDRYRKSHLEILEAFFEAKKNTISRTQAVPFTYQLDENSTPEMIADYLHAHHRHLASLPENEAEIIRADSIATLNRLHRHQALQDEAMIIHNPIEVSIKHLSE